MERLLSEKETEAKGEIENVCYTLDHSLLSLAIISVSNHNTALAGITKKKSDSSSQTTRQVANKPRLAQTYLGEKNKSEG